MEKWDPSQLEFNQKNKSNSANLNNLKDINVSVEAVLGSTNESIGRVMNYHQDQIVLLDRFYGELIDIRVNGKVIGKGEIVVVEEQLGIKIKKLNEYFSDHEV